MPLPTKTAELFGDTDPRILSERLDEFVAKINGAPSTHNGQVTSKIGNGPVLLEKATPPADLTSLITGDLAKALGADQVASITAALAAQQADLQKDLTLTSPLATGYVAYDLEPAAKLLTPRPTPLRNRIARRKGIGTSHRFKRITGFTGTGTGGVGFIHPGITDSTTNTFGAKSLIRGPKISYAGDESNVPYLQFSLSDQVPWSAQYSGMGFQDYRALSRASVLYASMLVEERMLLAGRGTLSPYSGAFAVPTGITATARAAGAGEIGLSLGATNVYVQVTVDSMFGDSVASAVVSVAVTAGQVVDVKVPTDIAGALGYRVYANSGAADPGAATRAFQGRTGYNTFTVGAGSATLLTAAPFAPTVDTSAQANGYDGIMAYAAGTNSGSVQRLNSAFSSTNPGTEFQTAFVNVYNTVKGDPDRALIQGQDRKQLSDLLKTASSSNYRLEVQSDGAGGHQFGAVVTGIQNEVTGKMLDLEVHPWMPQGNIAILSDTLPIPDSEVSDVFAAYNVQDYMAVDWPVDQFAFETSSYWYGTLCCYAPAWNAAIQGVKAV